MVILDTLRSLTSRYLLADTPPLSSMERGKSAIGAFLGMGVCGLLLHAMPVGSHWLIAPVGASTVILYVLPHSPVAQPWSVIGSYLAATLAALASSALVHYPPLAAAVAVAASIWLMARLNCIHPPGGALALFLVLDGPYGPAKMGLTTALVLLNVVVMLLVAVVVNNLLGRRYPYLTLPGTGNPHKTADASPMARIGINHEDLDKALRSLDTFVDVQEDELVDLYNLAVDHAFARHAGLMCADVMSRDLVTVQYGTELEEAWTMLRAHKIKALPVVDSFDRLIGIVTVADYLRQLDDTTAAGLAIRLQGLLRRTPGTDSEKAEVVGQIMSTEIQAARLDTPISELAMLLSDRSMHHIPVVDESRRVVGIVTQSDLIAALYKRVALNIA